MNDDNSKIDWPTVIFVFVVLPLAFIFGGFWIGLGTLIIGVVALGWSKRREGPFPTNADNPKKKKD